jgi:hypothetical protein
MISAGSRAHLAAFWIESIPMRPSAIRMMPTSLDFSLKKEAVPPSDCLVCLKHSSHLMNRHAAQQVKHTCSVSMRNNIKIERPPKGPRPALCPFVFCAHFFRESPLPTTLLSERPSDPAAYER